MKEDDIGYFGYFHFRNLLIALPLIVFELPTQHTCMYYCAFGCYLHKATCKFKYLIMSYHLG